MTQVPVATDEHGEVIPDASTPAYVITRENRERWRYAMGIAMQFTRQPEDHIESRNVAAVIYAMPNPTRPPEPLERPARKGVLRSRLSEALITRVNGIYRRRDRLGQFADMPDAPDVPDVPRRRDVPVTSPSSPGVSLAEIERLGLNRWPEPSEKTRAVLGDYEHTSAKWSAGPQSPGSDAPHAPYLPERRPVHDRAVGRALAGLPKLPGDKPTGVAELLGVDHPLVRKLHEGGQLEEAEKETIRVAARAARGDGPPEALFTAGGPASGKTTTLNVLRDEIRPANAVTVDADGLKEDLPEYVELRSVKDRYAALAVHEESGDLAERVTREAMDLELSVVIDGTGDSEPGVFRRQLERKRDAGYTVGVMYVTVPTDDAVVMAVGRAQETGRFVPIPRVRKLHRLVSEIFNSEISGLDWLDSLDVFEGQQHIATLAEGGRLVEFDPGRMRGFRAKAQEGEPVAGEQASLSEADHALPPGTRGPDAPVPPEDWTPEDPWDFDFLERPPIVYAEPKEPEGA